MLSKVSIEVINSLSILELDALRFMDNNKQVVLDLSIQNLAKRMFMSTATIMRLAKKLGFSGYSELKFAIRQELLEEEQSSSSFSYMTFIESHRRMLNETISLLDEKQITEVVDKMFRAKRIHLFGKGLNYTVLEYASKLLFTLGVKNFLYADTHIGYLAAEQMDEDDLVFLCSLSGNTHQTVRMAMIAKSRKATVVSVTSNTKNDLYDASDYVFGISTNPHFVRPKDIASRMQIILIFDILINMYARKMLD